MDSSNIFIQYPVTSGFNPLEYLVIRSNSLVGDFCAYRIDNTILRALNDTHGTRNVLKICFQLGDQTGKLVEAPHWHIPIIDTRVFRLVRTKWDKSLVL